MTYNDFEAKLYPIMGMEFRVGHWIDIAYRVGM
jgi:hypothetical protein